MHRNVTLVTGAGTGTGIGKLTAQSLAEAGHIVYATIRDVEGCNKPCAEEMRALTNAKDIQLHPLDLDVLSQESAAAATIIREQRRLDVVMLEVSERVRIEFARRIGMGTKRRSSAN